MTSLPTFKLEEYLNEWEFKTQYLLCCSDVESVKMQTLLGQANEAEKKLWESLTLSYTEPRGHPLLLLELQKYYRPLQIQNIITTAGAEEAIFCTLMTILNPGDHVITLVPHYESLAKLPQHFGADVTLLELRSENGWALDLQALKEAITPKTKMIILNYPHNPTGSHLTHAALNEVIELARLHDLYILNDEVYRLMEYEEAAQLPPLATCYEKGISISVMTKAFGMAGLRIGWVAAQDEKLIDKILNTKFYTSICNSAPSEILAIIALRQAESILKSAQQLIQINLKYLDAFIEKHASYLSWTRPKAGCIGLLKFDHTQITVDQLAHLALEQNKVLIMPSHIMGGDTKHFRIGFGRANFKEALAQFEQVLEKINR